MPEITEEQLAEFKAAQESNALLNASKKRLEDENSKYKTRAQDAEGKLTIAEKAKLDAEGDITARLEVEKEENKKLRMSIGETRKATLNEKLRTEVSKYAKGAHDVDMVLRVKEHAGLINADEEALTIDGAKEFVDKVRETHSYLFAKKGMDAGDNIPPKGDKDSNRSEDDKYLDELRNCNTRQEIAAVRKKYGKSLD